MIIEKVYWAFSQKVKYQSVILFQTFHLFTWCDGNDSAVDCCSTQVLVRSDVVTTLDDVVTTRDDETTVDVFVTSPNADVKGGDDAAAAN